MAGQLSNSPLNLKAPWLRVASSMQSFDLVRAKCSEQNWPACSAFLFGGCTLLFPFLFIYLETVPLPHTQGGVEYFEVYHGPINSTYGEVWWTSGSNSIPEDVVKRFDGKVMAIVGLEYVLLLLLLLFLF